MIGYKDLAALPQDKAILDIERPDLMMYQPHFCYSPAEVMLRFDAKTAQNTCVIVVVLMMLVVMVMIVTMMMFLTLEVLVSSVQLSLSLSRGETLHMSSTTMASSLDFFFCPCHVI